MVLFLHRTLVSLKSRIVSSCMVPGKFRHLRDAVVWHRSVTFQKVLSKSTRQMHTNSLNKVCNIDIFYCEEFVEKSPLGLALTSIDWRKIMLVSCFVFFVKITDAPYSKMYVLLNISRVCLICLLYVLQSWTSDESRNYQIFSENCMKMKEFGALP